MMLILNKNTFNINRLFPLFATVKLSALSLSVASLALSMSAMALPQSAQREIDPNAPIAALERLDSLKNVKPLEFKLPTIQHFSTRNGVLVSFVRTTELPILDIDLTFNAGSARDAAIREDGFGISNMTAAMLKGGTQTLDENEFNKQVEQLGVQLNTAAFKDMFKVTMRSLSHPRYLDPATELLEDMLANPSFDEEVLERQKAQLLSGLQQNSQYPAYVAEVAFTDTLLGDHPYGHLSSGSLESVPTITANDLRQFRQKFLVADNVKLTMTGDLTLEQAKALAEQLTTALPRGKKAAPLPNPAPITVSKRIDIPFDASQTTVKIGQIGFKRSANLSEIEKQESFFIGDEVLGGHGFGSRLMKEIRKNRGYTYGIYSTMASMQAKGPYTIGFSARQEVVEDAIDTTLDIVEETLDKGITEKELNQTKEKLINSYPKTFASNASINGMVASNNFYDLPDDYLTRYIERIEKTTLDDVNTALNETINPDKMVIVTVGKSSKE